MRALSALLLAIGVLACASAYGADGRHVRIATEGIYPPFNFADKDGKLTGFEVEIGNALCAAASLDCEWVTQEWDYLIPGLLANDYDAIMASMSITEERKQKVDFTNKYYDTPFRFVAKAGATFEFTDEGLKGKRIGVVGGTVGEDYLRDSFPRADVHAYGGEDESLADLAAGAVDLTLGDSVWLDENFLKTEEGKDYAFVGPVVTDKRYGAGVGVAVRKGDDELREALNAAIAKIRQDGTYKAMQAKYFAFDIYGE
jgi:arginine/ornithine transport system substrate-binding protein